MLSRATTAAAVRTAGVKCSPIERIVAALVSLKWFPYYGRAQRRPLGSGYDVGNSSVQLNLVEA